MIAETAFQRAVLHSPSIALSANPLEAFYSRRIPTIPDERPPLHCARVVSDHAACPPVVEYPAEFQARAAAEVEALPPGVAVETMLIDYHVLRQQARACQAALRW